MPAPATSSRHPYTGHHRGHIQPAPRLRAHRSEPSSRDHPQIPVSMPSLFRFDASAVVHTCSSSQRTPAPLTARRQPQRSPPRLLTDAACDGLESPPARRPRRTHPHHWHSTDRADDLLHHHHFPSGHTWVTETRPWSLTCRDAVRCGVFVYRSRDGAYGSPTAGSAAHLAAAAPLSASPSREANESTALLGAVSRHASIRILDRCMAPGDDAVRASWTAATPTAGGERTWRC